MAQSLLAIAESSSATRAANDSIVVLASDTDKTGGKVR